MNRPALIMLAVMWMWTGSLPAQQISAVEYYFDLDPGFGQATSIPINAGSNIEDVTQTISIAHLSYGFHTFFLRSKSSTGYWSLTNRFSFVKVRSDQPIQETEYFYDVDPGFGRGTPLALNAANTIADFIAQVNITNLSPGNHRLFIRSKEGFAENWSLTNYYDFTITSSDPAPFINVNSITDYSPCAGTSFRMAYHATGNHQPVNTFTVELSDGSGSFATPITIGAVVDTADRVVTCYLPKTLPYGTNYRIRVVSTNVAVTGIPNANPITIRPAPYLGNDTTVFVQCAQDYYDLTSIYNLTNLTPQWNLANPQQAPKGAYPLIVTNSYGCKDTVNIFVKQDVALWTGAVNTNWHEASNWSTGKVPGQITHVIIPAGTSNPCIISQANTTISSMQVREGAHYQITNGSIVNIVATCTPLPATSD